MVRWGGGYFSMKKRVLEVPNFVTPPNSLWTFQKSKKMFVFSQYFWGDREVVGWFRPPRFQATSRSHALLGLSIQNDRKLGYCWLTSIYMYYVSIQNQIKLLLFDIFFFAKMTQWITINAFYSLNCWIFYVLYSPPQFLSW